tara:strand:- start:38867 stop:39991 length:1125 start_codon:yes stop_codon:yes gene_type:complete
MSQKITLYTPWIGDISEEQLSFLRLIWSSYTQYNKDIKFIFLHIGAGSPDFPFENCLKSLTDETAPNVEIIRLSRSALRSRLNFLNPEILDFVHNLLPEHANHICGLKPFLPLLDDSWKRGAYWGWIDMDVLLDSKALSSNYLSLLESDSSLVSIFYKHGPLSLIKCEIMGFYETYLHQEGARSLLSFFNNTVSAGYGSFKSIRSWDDGGDQNSFKTTFKNACASKNLYYRMDASHCHIIGGEETQSFYSYANGQITWTNLERRVYGRPHHMVCLDAYNKSSDFLRFIHEENLVFDPALKYFFSVALKEDSFHPLYWKWSVPNKDPSHPHGRRFIYQPEGKTPARYSQRLTPASKFYLAFDFLREKSFINEPEF